MSDTSPKDAVKAVGTVTRRRSSDGLFVRWHGQIKAGDQLFTQDALSQVRKQAYERAALVVDAAFEKGSTLSPQDIMDAIRKLAEE